MEHEPRTMNCHLISFHPLPSKCIQVCEGQVSVWKLTTFATCAMQCHTNFAVSLRIQNFTKKMKKKHGPTDDPQLLPCQVSQVSDCSKA